MAEISPEVQEVVDQLTKGLADALALTKDDDEGDGDKPAALDVEAIGKAVADSVGAALAPVIERIDKMETRFAVGQEATDDQEAVEPGDIAKALGDQPQVLELIEGILNRLDVIDSRTAVTKSIKGQDGGDGGEKQSVWDGAMRAVAQGRKVTLS